MEDGDLIDCFLEQVRILHHGAILRVWAHFILPARWRNKDAHIIISLRVGCQLFSAFFHFLLILPVSDCCNIVPIWISLSPGSCYLSSASPTRRLFDTCSARTIQSESLLLFVAGIHDWHVQIWLQCQLSLLSRSDAWLVSHLYSQRSSFLSGFLTWEVHLFLWVGHSCFPIFVLPDFWIDFHFHSTRFKLSLPWTAPHPIRSVWKLYWKSKVRRCMHAYETCRHLKWRTLCVWLRFLSIAQLCTSLWKETSLWKSFWMCLLWVFRIFVWVFYSYNRGNHRKGWIWKEVPYRNRSPSCSHACKHISLSDSLRFTYAGVRIQGGDDETPESVRRTTKRFSSMLDARWPMMRILVGYGRGRRDRRALDAGEYVVSLASVVSMLIFFRYNTGRGRSLQSIFDRNSIV